MRAVRRITAALVIGTATASLVVSMPTPVYAQSPGELERARTLYSQGLDQEAAGDWAGALATFERVGRIKMTPQVRYHIARSKEKLGRLNEALGGYRMAEHAAVQAGAGAETVLQEIRAAAEELEKRVPKVIIERGEGAETLRIELDGVKLGQPQIGRPVNVDPGPHEVVGILPSGKRFKRTFQAKEGATEQLIMDVPPDLHATADADDPLAGGSGTGQPDDDGTASATGAVDAGTTTDEGSSVLPWISIGVGAVGLLAAGVFYTRARTAENDLEDECITQVCPENLESTGDDGKQATMLTNVSLGVGIVGIGLGTILLLSEGGSDQAALPSSKPKKKAASMRVLVDTAPQSTGVRLVGSF